MSKPVLIRMAVAGLALAAAAAASAADLPRVAPELAIGLTGGKQILLSQYKGKVVAMCFILTTCPHCQRTVGILSKMQNELGPRGFQALASAIQEGAALAVPGFIREFNPAFPVGFNNPDPAITWMQHPPMLIPHMPLLAFVDQKGMIRAQHEGDDLTFFGDQQQEQNIRNQIEALLKDGAAPAKSGAAKKSATPKK